MIKFLLLFLMFCFLSPAQGFGDRNKERESASQITNKILDIFSNNKCITSEELLRREIILEQREKALKSELDSIMPIVRSEYLNGARNCYRDTANYIEYSGCLEGIK